MKRNNKLKKTERSLKVMVATMAVIGLELVLKVVSKISRRSKALLLVSVSIGSRVWRVIRLLEVDWVLCLVRNLSQGSSVKILVIVILQLSIHFHLILNHHQELPPALIGLDTLKPHQLALVVVYSQNQSPSFHLSPSRNKTLFLRFKKRRIGSSCTTK